MCPGRLHQVDAGARGSAPGDQSGEFLQPLSARFPGGEDQVQHVVFDLPLDNDIVQQLPGL